jgi:uncharacterized protein YigE (DUF2233 family)
MHLTPKTFYMPLKQLQFVVQNGKVNNSLPSLGTAIRNGAGITKDGRVIFAISTTSVTFLEFANYFISQGCITAVYFDGGVSKAYFGDGDYSIPGNRRRSGSMGAMIAVIN